MYRVRAKGTFYDKTSASKIKLSTTKSPEYRLTISNTSLLPLLKQNLTFLPKFRKKKSIIFQLFTNSNGNI